MGRLIKADWYRITKGGKPLKVYLILILVSLCFPFLELLNGIRINEFTLKMYLESSEENSISMIVLMMVVFGALFVGLSYNNKTLCYEVMAGNKITDIINSKICTIVPLLSLIFMSGFLMFSLVLGLMNGIGEMPQLPLRMFLLFIVMLHAIMIGILPTMIAKNLGGMAIGIMRIEVFDLVIMMFAAGQMSGGSNFFRNIYNNWLFLNQVYIFTKEKIDSGFVIGVIGGFVIEMAIWYILAYISYKKKNFS